MPPKAPCGNPLFLQWIEELRDQTKKKGSKAYESYSKAARSLAACPVSYPRPRDLVVLVGIGPKTIGILEGKWKKHCEENGLPPPGSPAKRPAPGHAKSKGKEKTRLIPLFDFGSDEGTGSEAEEPPPTPPPVKKRKPAKPKTYIPQKGSGGYGILLGLVLAIEKPQLDTQVFLTKTELIRKAQPYCEASYDHSEKGTYFTAWNSMKTLVGKGYVYVTGNPHKYCLTEEGYDVACAIRALLPEFAHVEKHPFLHEPASPLDIVPTARSNPVLESRNHLPTPPPTVAESSHMATQRSTSAGKFQFWYIDSAQQRVDQVSSAMVRLDPVDFITLRKIEFLEMQKTHPFVAQLRLVDSAAEDRDGHRSLYGFIEEETAPPRCSQFEKPASTRAAPQATSRILSHVPTPISDDDEEDWVALPSAKSTPIKSVPLPNISSSSNMTGVRPLAGPSVSSLKGKGMDREASFARTLSNTSNPRRPAGPRLSSHVQPAHPLEAASSTNVANLPDFAPSDAIVYPAGSYEIVLILDTREIESKSNRDRFAEKLADKGVKIETRALRLGDVCWVARRLDGLGGEEDECVLDYVLERKRLDDLCSSIRDGRYHEQCFRLSNSGISNVFYLVEDWQTSHHMEFSGQQILTAKSQIQVHNRFILKETHKLSESIDFLATMTGVIRDRLSDTDLHIIPTRYLSRSSYLPLRTHLKECDPQTTWHTSFQAYQDLNDKSASTTLRDKWARMLLCVKGMSAERVSAVLDEFETPRDMWDALKERVKQARREAEREQSLGESLEGSLGKSKKKVKVRGPELFFADRIKGEGRRKIGDALSRDVSGLCVWSSWRAHEKLFKVFMGTVEESG